MAYATNPGTTLLRLQLSLYHALTMPQAFLVSGVHLDALIILDAYPSDAVAAR